MFSSCAAALAGDFAATGRTSVSDVPMRQKLVGDFPGLQYQSLGGVQVFFGKPMTSADTAQAAADLWLGQYAGAFGIADLELESLWTANADHGKFTVFGFRQRMAGLPVEHSLARILVNNDLGHSVVFASAVLAHAPADGLSGATVAAEAALTLVQGMNDYQSLPMWSAPELVVFAGEQESMLARPAWKFVGEQPALDARRKLSFFVDAAGGTLLQARNEVLSVDVVGTVTGMGTPGTLPDTASNPPVQMPIADIRMSITGGSNAYSNRDGTFTITNGGTSPVTVTTNTSSGRWVDVGDRLGSPDPNFSGSFTPGVPQTINLNNPTTATPTSAINVFVSTTFTHNYYRDRAEFTMLDNVIPGNVNVAGTCNAYFDGGSINFYAAGGGCVNTAYSTVVAHEYGHNIVQQLGLAQGGFGEGFGDVSAMLAYDTPIVGENFFTSGADIRNPSASNRQYPCSGEVHFCGELIGGVWWDLRINFNATLGSNALAVAQQLEADWALITHGGTGASQNNSADPTTAIEVLTVDDDDGDISNGTPNYDEICASFSSHNIDCPVVRLVAFQYPDGVPTFLQPDAPTSFSVNVVGVGTGEPMPGTGILYYKAASSGTFTAVLMTQGAPNNYTATLPAAACPNALNFYFTVLPVGAPAQADPPDAPTSFYTAMVGFEDFSFSDDMSTNTGWVSGAPGDDATTGKWNRMAPQDTGAQPGGDHTTGTGLCWVTDGNAGSSVGSFDVDNGRTTLLTPVFDLSTVQSASIGYWRWYSNDQGSAIDDSFTVDISSDNGATWANVETIGVGNIQASGGWYFHSFQAESKVALTSTVKLRFVASDLFDGSIVEAAIDDFSLQSAICVGGCPQPGCAEFDIAGGNCIIDLSDLAVLLGNYGQSGPGILGDFNDDDLVDLIDLAILLGKYGSDCN